MNSFDYCIDQLQKAGIFSKYPNAENHWQAFKRSPLCKREKQAQETQIHYSSDPVTDPKAQEKKSELNMIYFQIDGLKELYAMQEKQLKGNVSEKQRLTIKNSLLSKAIRIQKLEQKAGKLEHELGMI